MKYVFPVIFTKLDEGGYMAFAPDLEINTQGESLAEAIAMARDAICLVCVDLEDDGKVIPTPSSAVNCKEGEILSYVDADVGAYRLSLERRTVRRNESLPAWLDKAAKDSDINVSAVLVNALKAELHIIDR